MAIPDAMQSRVGRSVVISTRSIGGDYGELKRTQLVDLSQIDIEINFLKVLKVFSDKIYCNVYGNESVISDLRENSR